MCFFLSYFFGALTVCFRSLSYLNTHSRPIFSVLAEARRFSFMISMYLAPSIFPSTRYSRPVPLAEKKPQIIMFPLSFLMIDGVLEVQINVFYIQTRRIELTPKSSILVSSDNSTFFQASSESSRTLLANFRRACTSAFLSRGTLVGTTWFQSTAMLCVILVTVVSAFLSWSSGLFLTFLITRFTPRWEILCGSSDRGWLIVNWCFFHFLIIAPTVDSFSPSCLPIVLQLISVLCWYTILFRMSLDNSFVFLIVERLDSNSLKDSMSFIR